MFNKSNKIALSGIWKGDSSDSVGIRTQDPQLRRLLLYPAELPNRSVMFFCLSLGMRDITRDKSGCKGSVFFRICNTVGGNFVPDVRLYVGSAVKNVLPEPWYCWHLGRFLPEI